jgi:hypothetical protein
MLTALLHDLIIQNHVYCISRLVTGLTVGVNVGRVTLIPLINLFLAVNLQAVNLLKSYLIIKHIYRE